MSKVALDLGTTWVKAASKHVEATAKQEHNAPASHHDTYDASTHTEASPVYKPYKNGVSTMGQASQDLTGGPTTLGIGSASATQTTNPPATGHSSRLYLQYTPVEAAPKFYHTNVLILDEKGNGHEWAAYPKFNATGTPVTISIDKVKDEPVHGFDTSKLQPISGELDDKQAKKLESGFNDLTNEVNRQEFPYHEVLQNSNSYAATLLHGTGYQFPLAGHPPTPGCGTVLIPWTGW